MASYRDRAFEAWYQGVADKSGIGGRDLMRKAWDAGRLYESKRRDGLLRSRVEIPGLGITLTKDEAADPIPATWSGPFTADD